MSTFGGSQGETPSTPPGPQPPYQPPPYYRASAVRIPRFPRGPRRQYPIETKPFFLTSEFAVFAIATLALVITAAVDNSIDSRYFWAVEAIFVAFYMLSRGIAKAGTKSHAPDPRER